MEYEIIEEKILSLLITRCWEYLNMENCQHFLSVTDPLGVSVHCSLVPSWARANAQTPSDDNAWISWAWKCNPAKILAGQSESSK